MIHVRVGEQDEINRRELRLRDSDINQAFDANGERTYANAHARAEDGVSENGEAVDIQENGAVAEPRSVQSLGAPELRLRSKRRGLRLAVIFLGNLAKKRRGSLPQKARGGGNAAAKIRVRGAAGRALVAAKLGIVHQGN